MEFLTVGSNTEAMFLQVCPCCVWIVSRTERTRCEGSTKYSPAAVDRLFHERTVNDDIVQKGLKTASTDVNTALSKYLKKTALQMIHEEEMH